MRGQLEIRQKGSPNFYRYSGSYSFRQNERSSGEKYISTDRYDVNMIYRRTVATNWFIQNSLGYRSDGVKGIKRVRRFQRVRRSERIKLIKRIK